MLFAKKLCAFIFSCLIGILSTAKHISPRNIHLIFERENKTFVSYISLIVPLVSKSDNILLQQMTLCNDSKFTFACSISSLDTFLIYFAATWNEKKRTFDSNNGYGKLCSNICICSSISFIITY